MDDASVRDDGAFVVFTRPKVEVVVRVLLYLSATVIQPRVPYVSSAEQFDQEIVTVNGGEPAHGGMVLAFAVQCVPDGQQATEWCAL